MLTSEAVAATVRAAQQAVANTARTEAAAGNNGPTTGGSRRGGPLTRLRGRRAGGKAAGPQDVGRDAEEVASAIEMLDGLILGLLDSAG